MTDNTEPAAAVATEDPAIVSIEQWADQLGISNKAVLTAGEAAEILRVSERSVREMIKVGTVPSVRLGRRLLVPVPMLLKSLLAEPQYD